ncbi:oxidation resistance protein 1, partial [Ascosphaera acerosa]
PGRASASASASVLRTYDGSSAPPAQSRGSLSLVTDTPSSYFSTVTSYFSHPLGQAVTGLYRRFTDPGVDSAVPGSDIDIESRRHTSQSNRPHTETRDQEQIIDDDECCCEDAVSDTSFDATLITTTTSAESPLTRDREQEHAHAHDLRHEHACRRGSSSSTTGVTVLNASGVIQQHHRTRSSLEEYQRRGQGRKKHEGKEKGQRRTGPPHSASGAEQTEAPSATGTGKRPAIGVRALTSAMASFSSRFSARSRSSGGSNSGSGPSSDGRHPPGDSASTPTPQSRTQSRTYGFGSTSGSTPRVASGSGSASTGRGSDARSGAYTPPPRPRTSSPFNPPPLAPLTLSAAGNIAPGEVLLTRALAEEVRLLVPPRLQLVDTWRLAYSLERDGSSLTTLYARCREVAGRHPRAGYVLVIKDASASASGVAREDGGGSGASGGGDRATSPGGGGGSSSSSSSGGSSNSGSSNNNGTTRPATCRFGAYLSDPPHPAAHFYGTGECFLWKANVIPMAGTGSGTASPMLRALAQPPPGHGTNGPSATTLSQASITEAIREAQLPPPPSIEPTVPPGRSTSVCECECGLAGRVYSLDGRSISR